MLKKSGRCIISTILVLVLFLALTVPALAASIKTVVSIPTNQKWASVPTVTRTGAWASVYARNHSVYPASGTDNYHTIQCRVVSEGRTLLSNDSYVLLSETASASTLIGLRDGYLQFTDIVFQFRGNTDSGAEAVVSYDPR